MGASSYVFELCEAALADGPGVAIMLRIYMDESGTHDGSPVVSVAAYAGQPKGWKLFERDWKIAKRPIDVFHATDCEALRGEFAGWTPEDRNELVKRLLAVLPRYELRGNAIAINVADFNEAVATGMTNVPVLRSNRDDRVIRALFGSPYALCFQIVVDNIIWQMERIGMNDAIAFFHEENDFQREALEAFDFVKAARRRHTGPMTITFAPKNKFIPLQAADILAFEANKRARDQGRPVRRSLTAMDPDNDRIHIGIIDKKNADDAVKRLIATYNEIKVLGRPASLFDG